MNKMQKILADVTDDELRQVIDEFRVLDETGVLPKGVVRAVVRKIHDEADIPANDALKVAQAQLIWRAALQWAKTSKPAPGGS